jgi:hypothetical protein
VQEAERVESLLPQFFKKEDIAMSLIPTLFRLRWTSVLSVATTGVWIKWCVAKRRGGQWGVAKGEA